MEKSAHYCPQCFKYINITALVRKEDIFLYKAISFLMSVRLMWVNSTDAQVMRTQRLDLKGRKTNSKL